MVRLLISERFVINAYRAAIEMTFLSILETLLLGPLKLIFEIIFDIGYRFTRRPELAIIFLSFIMNILVLPLYRRADAMQENARDTEAKLHDGAAHIKKTFSGDEQMMILQTYYRQNHYKPTDALSGSVSLLLEIPFFIAAYQFLSHLEIFQGLSLGPIADLSAPDGLLVIGGVSVNLLPILMTLINVVSSALYLKGFPLKTKIQLYGMALLFLIFLYASPACLVFYWTLNNIFSLVKNIFYKLKNPRKTLRVLCAGTGAALLGFGVVFYHSGSLKRRLFLLGVGLVLLLPLLFPTLKKALPLRKAGSQPNPKLFLLSTVFLTVLIGLLIPSALIADSPQEFVDITCFHHPLWYIASTFCMAAGTFLIWTRMFYWLASPAGKGLFGRLIWILCGAALVNYLFFGTDLGVISSSLQYDDGMSFSMRQKLMNLLILTVAAAVLYFIARKWKRTAANILIISIVALGAMSAWNLFTIKASVDAIPAQQLSESDTPHFRLSTTGKNVIVLMLDRAMGEYIPYLFNEKPELKEKFDGFTYYENTISFGGSTIFGAPPLFGGYEYTPVEMNRREEVPLISKHNESLKVMPAVFSENGYEVTVCDPPYANYQGIPDLSIYDDCPGVTAYIAKGRFATSAQKLASIEQNHRNFFCFSVMKAMPLFVQPILYDKGLYIQFNSSVVQIRDGLFRSSGMSSGFMSNYQVLLNLSNMTQVTADAANTLLLFTNDTTHNPMMLQEPDYTPALNVDNTAYDATHADMFVIDGRELRVGEENQMLHYQVNMAAMIQLGNWFDYLREHNVYDNTRIILASDHAYNLSQLDALILGDEPHKDVERFYPLLMVKDFDSRGFVTSDTFMTNADVPTLAMKDIIQNPKNPFTGNAINDDEKAAHDQFIILSTEWLFGKDSGNAFLPSEWTSIRDNIWDKDNWSFYDEATVLDEHAMP